jgi:hypothetical protein
MYLEAQMSLHPLHFQCVAATSSQYLRTGMYATTGLEPREDYSAVDVIGG